MNFSSVVLEGFNLPWNSLVIGESVANVPI